MYSFELWNQFFKKIKIEAAIDLGNMDRGWENHRPKLRQIQSNHSSYLFVYRFSHLGFDVSRPRLILTFKAASLAKLQSQAERKQRNIRFTAAVVLARLQSLDETRARNVKPKMRKASVLAQLQPPAAFVPARQSYVSDYKKQVKTFEKSSKFPRPFEASILSIFEKLFH